MMSAEFLMLSQPLLWVPACFSDVKVNPDLKHRRRGKGVVHLKSIIEESPAEAGAGTMEKNWFLACLQLLFS